MTQRFSISARARSFVYAGRGLRDIVVTQHNAWLHGLATCGVVAAGLALNVTQTEWLMLTLAIASVWTAESLNTAFELLCDAVHPEVHPLVARAKDAAAGAVLITALGATVLGTLVFAPHLRALWYT